MDLGSSEDDNVVHLHCDESSSDEDADINVEGGINGNGTYIRTKVAIKYLDWMGHDMRSTLENVVRIGTYRIDSNISSGDGVEIGHAPEHLWMTCILIFLELQRQEFLLTRRCQTGLIQDWGSWGLVPYGIV